MITEDTYNWRHKLVMLLASTAAVVLIWRAIELQVLDKQFLEVQGKARYLRTINIPASRGMITDRNEEPLAISTPVDSIWVNPAELFESPENIRLLASVLGIDLEVLNNMLAKRSDKGFVYIKRHADLESVDKVVSNEIPGVYLQKEFRRYYPAAEITGHVIGFTNIDDIGQEGLELAYNDWLRGTPGKKRVVRDRLGRIVADVEIVKNADPGKDLVTSLDKRIQYLAYRELKSAVQENQARAASAVMLDVTTGEVLAMVNQPAYNPNLRRDLSAENYRNRAVTDLFEPGSTIKPFTIAVALETGSISPGEKIDTSPGYIRVSGKKINDRSNFGIIDLTRLISKSSNVGAAKVALSIPKERMWRFFTRLGFGQGAQSGFPGEAIGVLTHFSSWVDVNQAALAFGYGMSVTPLKLAQAYTVLASGGYLRPVSFVKINKPGFYEKIISTDNASLVQNMLRAVVLPGGTGHFAAVDRYKVAGKTGTVRKFINGKYSENRYVAIFAGFAPMKNPRLAMVVIIDEPSKDKYYGGQVAAPVFSKIMSGALRLLNVEPDNIDVGATHLASLVSR